jgi:hypothetical protein
MTVTTEYCFELDEIPENILAKKIKEDVIDKLLSCSTKEEVQLKLNEIIKENYESLDIEELRTGAAPIGPVLDSFVACSLEDSTENLTNVQIQIGDLLKNAIDLVCNPPTFNIPAPYPIIDISDAFLKQLFLAFLRLIMKIILSLLKKILSLIIDICQSGLSVQNLFGSQNFGDILSDAFGGAVDEATSFINEVFGAFGIDPNGIPATSIVEGEGCLEPITLGENKATSQFLNDLSSVLTPLEICDLFDNNTNEQTFQVIEELMKYEYPNFGAVFNTRTKIRDLFKLLGKKVDPRLCQTIRENADKVTSNPDICFTNEAIELRKNFLGKKRLSDEQIEQLLDKEREAQTTNLDKIGQIIAAIKTNPNSLFGDQQDIFCKNGQSGIVSMDMMPSLRNSATNTLNYTYNIYAVTAIKEIEAFGGKLLVQEKILDAEEPVIPKFAAYTIQDSEGNTKTFPNMVNPTFTQRTSFGHFDLCDDEGAIDNDSLLSFYNNKDNAQDDDGNIDIQKVISVTSKKDAKKLGGDNVYIANYKSTPKIANDFYNTGSGFGLFYINSTELALRISDLGAAQYKTRIKDFISYDTGSMSVTINIPTKFLPFGQQETKPDFATIESTDNLIVYVTGTV